MNNSSVKGSRVVVPENPLSQFLFSDTRSAIIWLIIRLYVGYSWITAGWKKVNSSK